MSYWIFVTAFSICEGRVVASPLLPERVYQAAQERTAVGGYPALVIGYIDGRRQEVDVFGKLDNGKTPDAETVFEIGSITKTFTATLLAVAVQSRDLKLEDAIATLLPDVKVPEHNGKVISLIDVATQYSGLPRLPNNLRPTDPANPYADYGAPQLKAFLAGYTLLRDPGESFEYSNFSFGMLGFALAEHAHVSYDALLATTILRPLGMSSTSTAFSVAMRSHLARGHGADGNKVKNWDFDALAGAGAIRSTVADMLRYLKANMHAPTSRLTTAMKFAQEPRRDAGRGERIGLAWLTRLNPRGDVVWHNGGTGGYRSFLGFTADGRRGVVILTNTITSVDDLGFATLLDDAPIRVLHKALPIDAAALDDYTGTFKLGEHFLVTVSRQNDQLFAHATGQGAIRLFPSGKDEFFARSGDITVNFNRDIQGKVTDFILHQNGDRMAPKLTSAEATLESGGVELDPAILNDYIGKYKLASGSTFDITLDEGQLRAQLSGQGSFPIYASAKDRFFYTVVVVQLEFERDARGSVIALVLHQNGQDQRALRVSP